MTTLLIGLILGAVLGMVIEGVGYAWQQVRTCEHCQTTREPAWQEPAVPTSDLASSAIENRVTEYPIYEVQPGPLAPPVKLVSCVIDLDRLAEAESRNEATAVSRTGARGPYQLMEPTFRQMAADLHQADQWRWPEDAADPRISRMIAHQYINKAIPQMLHAYDLPDSQIMRLACYNWGIGHLIQAHQQPGGIVANMPDETRELIKRYVGTSRTKKR
jgi:hypothetical protein